MSASSRRARFALASAKLPEQAAVDQDEAVDLAVARMPGEVPCRVCDRRRGAGRVAAQDHLAPAAGARALDHGAQVVQLHLQPPLGDELGVRAGHAVVLEAEVVVECLVRVAAPEHRHVLEGLLTAVDDPDLRTRHAPDDVARDRHDPAGAAQRARHEHQHLRRVLRAELLDPDAVVLRRPWRGRDLHRDVAVDRRRRGGADQASDEGGSQGQAHGATLHRAPAPPPRAGRASGRARAWRARRSRAARPRRRPPRPRRPRGSRGRRPRTPGPSRARRWSSGAAHGGRRPPPPRRELEQPLDQRARRRDGSAPSLALRSAASACVHPLLPRLAQDRGDPRVRVLDVVDGVVLGLAAGQLEVEVDRGVVAARERGTSARRPRRCRRSARRA